MYIMKKNEITSYFALQLSAVRFIADIFEIGK